MQGEALGISCECVCRKILKDSYIHSTTIDCLLHARNSLGVRNTIVNTTLSELTELTFQWWEAKTKNINICQVYDEFYGDSCYKENKANKGYRGRCGGLAVLHKVIREGLLRWHLTSRPWNNEPEKNRDTGGHEREWILGATWRWYGKQNAMINFLKCFWDVD